MLDDERNYPPGTIPGAVGALGALAAIVLACGILFGVLLAFCDRREPVQMMPSPAAVATASAQVVATQSVRVTVRRPSGYNQGITPPGAPPVVRTTKQESPGGLFLPEDQGEEIVIEVSQGIAATASAQASASVVSPEASVVSPRASVVSHGRLGILAATLPGILAADLEIARVDVPPWLVGVPMEVGMDVAGNAQAGALGATVGGKGFVGGYAWSSWNLSEQGLALGAGLRF